MRKLLLKRHLKSVVRSRYPGIILQDRTEIGMQHPQPVHIRVCAVDAGIQLDGIRQVIGLGSHVRHSRQNVAPELVLDRKVPRLHAADFEAWREGSLHEYRLDELDAARWRVVRRGERRERALASSGREDAPGIGKWNRGATGDKRAARGWRVEVMRRR